MPLDYSEYNAYDIDQQIMADPVTRRQLNLITQGREQSKFSAWAAWAGVQLVLGIFAVIEVIVATRAFDSGGNISASEIFAFVIIALLAAMVGLTIYIAGKQVRGAVPQERRTADETLIGIYISAMRQSALNPDFQYAIESGRGRSDDRHNANGDESSAWS